jgi:hypothetical protein
VQLQYLLSAFRLSLAGPFDQSVAASIKANVNPHDTHKFRTMSSTKKPLPFYVTFTAGAIAGVSEILTFYPLDVVKTRMQLVHGKSSIGLVGSFKDIIRQEGFGRLYRGRRTSRLDSAHMTIFYVHKVSSLHCYLKHPSVPQNCTCSLNLALPRFEPRNINSVPQMISGERLLRR